MYFPAEYVCDGESEDIDSSNNDTDWYDAVDLMLVELSKETSESYLFNMTCHTRNHKHRGRHSGHTGFSLTPRTQTQKPSA